MDACLLKVYMSFSLIDFRLILSYTSKRSDSTYFQALCLSFAEVNGIAYLLSPYRRLMETCSKSIIPSFHEKIKHFLQFNIKLQAGCPSAICCVIGSELINAGVIIIFHNMCQFLLVPGPPMHRTFLKKNWYKIGAVPSHKRRVFGPSGRLLPTFPGSSPGSPGRLKKNLEKP